MPGQEEKEMLVQLAKLRQQMASMSNSVSVPLTAQQAKDLFEACQAKHNVVNSNFVSKVAAISSVTDITQTGIDAVNAIVW